MAQAFSITSTPRISFVAAEEKHEQQAIEVFENIKELMALLGTQTVEESGRAFAQRSELPPGGRKEQNRHFLLYEKSSQNSSVCSIIIAGILTRKLFTLEAFFSRRSTTAKGLVVKLRVISRVWPKSMVSKRFSVEWDSKTGELYAFGPTVVILRLRK